MMYDKADRQITIIFTSSLHKTFVFTELLREYRYKHLVEFMSLERQVLEMELPMLAVASMKHKFL